MLLSAGRLPTMIMEIASGNDGTDEYKMMLQAGALVRIAHRVQPGEPFVVVGIYIDNSLVATRNLFCLDPEPNKNEDVSLLLLTMDRSRRN